MHLDADGFWNMYHDEDQPTFDDLNAIYTSQEYPHEANAVFDDLHHVAYDTLVGRIITPVDANRTSHFASRSRVFNITELLDAILELIPERELLFTMQRVSKRVRCYIESSPFLQRQLCLESDWQTKIVRPSILGIPYELAVQSMAGGAFLGDLAGSYLRREPGQRFELGLLNLASDCAIQDTRRNILVCQPPPTSASLVSYGSHSHERVAAIKNANGITYGDIWDAFQAARNGGRWGSSHSYGMGWTLSN